MMAVFPETEEELNQRQTYEEWKAEKEKDGKVFTSQKGNVTIQTGGRFDIGTDEWFKENDRNDEIARKYYDKIRKTDDIIPVSEASGFSVKDIQTIKQHIFFEKHIKYDGEIARFDPDYNMAVAWQRLKNGVPKKRDILLLNHELYESQEERSQNLNASDAHRLADMKYPWFMTMMEETGGGEDSDLLQFD